MNNELASYQNDEESRNKMIDILKRMNEELGEEQAGEIMENIDELDSDDDIEVDLHERIKDINLDNADHVWDALTEDEQNDFEALLNKGTTQLRSFRTKSDTFLFHLISLNGFDALCSDL